MGQPEALGDFLGEAEAEAVTEGLLLFAREAVGGGDTEEQGEAVGEKVAEDVEQGDNDPGAVALG